MERPVWLRLYQLEATGWYLIDEPGRGWGRGIELVRLDDGAVELLSPFGGLVIS